MFRPSLREMTKGRWREFVREPSALFFVIMMPIVWMLLLGGVFTGEQKDHFRIGIDQQVWESEDSQSKVFSLALQSHPQMTSEIGEKSELVKQLNRNQISLIITRGEDAPYEYIFDPSNPAGRQAKRLVNDIVQTSLGRQDVLSMQEVELKVNGQRYIDFLIPGLLALSLFTTSLFGTGMTIVANRRENLLKRYCVTPMRMGDYILSHILGRYMIAVVECATVLGMGFLVFDFRIQGSGLEFVTLIFLGIATFTALGILAGSRTSNSSTYNGFINLVSLPLMLMAGVWFSKAYFPSWLGAIVDYLPLTALVSALREVALEGAGFGQITMQMGVLAVYGLVSSILAAKIFRWY